jgi:hypothetical protein
VDQKKQDHKPPSADGGWAEARSVKGTTADLRRSAATLREQVAKESRVFSRTTNTSDDEKKR